MANLNAIPAGFGTVTFSIMATRTQQRSDTGIGAHPLAPPWEVRRELLTQYLTGRGFDFAGLKHCQLERGSQDSALHQIFKAVNRDAAVYGKLDAVIRTRPEDPEKGDTLSILYRKDRWRLLADRSGPVWHSVAPPENQPGSRGNVFNFAVFDRRGRTDGIRPQRLHLYNIRMRDKASDALELYRAFCLGEILSHMQQHAEPDVPAVLLCDTNCKVAGSIADRLFLGQDAEMPGLTLSPSLRLRDSYLDLHPDAHGKVRTQHNYVDPGRISGNERNNRVLYHGALQVTDAEISTWPGDATRMPSYHYPVESWFRHTVA